MDERLRSFYDDKYRNPIENGGVVARATRARFPRDRYEALISFFVPCDRVLDVGAGDASEIQLLRPLCRQITVTEISEVRAARITETYSGDASVSVFLHNLEEGPGLLNGQTFDAIVMNAVVEHLVDPIQTLITTRGLIRSGGYLLLTTPNIAKWTRRTKLLFGRFPGTAAVDEGLLQYDRTSPTALYDEGHLHYFTYRSLSRVLVERAGFSRVDRLCFGRPGFLAWAWPTMFSEVCLRAHV